MNGIVLLALLFCLPLSYEESLSKRHSSSYQLQHPAFSMFRHSPMVFPGLQNSGPVYSDCITEDIVCPSWCLMEDDWGCKTCPCGPANGMSPVVLSESHTEHREKQHECLGTILCMLTCKDGYRLGPRGDNGCQACSCTKKNRTQTQTPPTTTVPSKSTSHTTPSNQTGNKKVPATSTGSKGCAWPLCMNAQSPAGGPSVNGRGTGTGHSLSGAGSTGDCFGPSCSAKNGMRLMNSGGMRKGTAPNPAMTMHVPAIPTKQTPPTHSPQCAAADACMSGCRGSVHLSPPVKLGGCPVCKCYKVPSPNPTPKYCSQLVRCKKECRGGFVVTPPSDGNTCPKCSCLAYSQQIYEVINAKTPSPVGDQVTRRPSNNHINKANVSNRLSLATDYSTSGTSMRLTHEVINGGIRTPNKGAITPDTAIEACPETVRCILRCGGGYHLIPDNVSSCPKCICEKNGVKCTGSDCQPTILTAPTGHMLSPGQCVAILSCVMHCPSGYDIGEQDQEGCPTCKCIDGTHNSMTDAFR